MPISVRFVLDAETSDGSATAFECEVPADAVMSAAHSHDGFEETNYGLAGVTTFTVDGEPRELHPGEVVFIPRGAVHAFENRSDDDAKFLAVVDARASSERTTSTRSPRCSAPRPEVRPTGPRSARSCAATASPRPSQPLTRDRRDDMTYLIVGLDRTTLAPWHGNVARARPGQRHPGRPRARRR